MKKITKLISIILCIIMIMAAASACAGKDKASAPELLKGTLIHEPEFGGVYITMTIDDFNKLGFEYGDSVDITFSNGYKLEEIPYYNGYYTANGDPLLIAYPGYDYIKAAINNGDDLWTAADLSETDTADIKLHERGRFIDIQQARDIHYEDERSKFPGDEAFANFRVVSAGNIAADTLYRSASPCDNQHNRAPYVDKLSEEAGIGCILNLADTDAKIEGYISAQGFDSPYFLELYKAGKVVLFTLNMNFTSQDFSQKVAKGLKAVIDNEGPYLVHCTEGKDRTGFVCMLLEALCGASYQEIVDDYMITYDNYYEITLAKDEARYTVIVDNVLNPMIQAVAGNEDIKTADLSAGAEKFLLSAGMEQQEIEALRSRLTGK